MFFHIGYITVLLPYTDTKLPPSKVLHETLPRRFGGSLLPHPSSCLPGSGPHRSQKWASSLGGCGSSHPSALYDLLRHDRGPKRRSLLTKPLFPFLSRFMGLSQPGSFVFITGLLCGYPMGARMDSRFLEEGRIELNEARTLLAVSNHPSPMFILGYICVQAASLFSSSNACPPWIFLTALYLPILPVSFLAKKCYHLNQEASLCRQDNYKSEHTHVSFDTHLMDCLETMEKIGLYIMIFSILALYLSALPDSLLPLTLRCALLGAVEITTGIRAISGSVPGFAGALLITAAGAFGGISGIFQTKSVLKSAGLSIRHYILWKFFHSVLSCVAFALCFFINQSLQIGI